MFRHSRTYFSFGIFRRIRSDRQRRCDPLRKRTPIDASRMPSNRTAARSARTGSPGARILHRPFVHTAKRPQRDTSPRHPPHLHESVFRPCFPTDGRACHSSVAAAVPTAFGPRDIPDGGRRGTPQNGSPHYAASRRSPPANRSAARPATGRDWPERMSGPCASRFRSDNTTRPVRNRVPYVA